MNIREMKKDDVAQVAQLVASLSHFYLVNKEINLPKWFEKTLTESEFVNRLLNPEHSNFVCEVDGLIIGYISIKDNNHLYHLFVSEKLQKKEVAKKLWQHTMAHCVSNIYTLNSSLYAVPVYKKLGFVESSAIQEKDGLQFQPMKLEI